MMGWLPWLDQQRPPNCHPAGWRAFQLGLVFLPTSALIAGLSLLASLTLWRPTAQPRPLSRPLARWLLGLGLWMLLTSVASPVPLELKLRLGNWLPFFWLLLAAPPYLATAAARDRFSLMVLVATVPALLVGLAQAVIGFSGPWQALGSLLIWDLPARFAAQGAGVFPNPNFTAAWYAMAAPLAAARVLTLPASARAGQRCASWILLLLLAVALVLSGSRTALSGTLLALLLLSWRQFWKPLTVGLATLVGLSVAALLLPAQSPAGLLAQRLSGGLGAKFMPMVQGAGSTAAEAIASGRDPYRSELFAQALQFVQQHPWLGLAESLLGSGPVHQPALLTHTHNVVFQLAIQHGLVASLALLTIVGALVVRPWWSTRNLGLKDRALLAASLGAIWLHGFDIPSFDSRNNVLGWLLLTCCYGLARPDPFKPESDQG
jgi:O-antigen ligase